MKDPRSKDNIELHNLNNHFSNILSKQRPRSTHTILSKKNKPETNFSLKIFLPRANAQSLYKFHFIHHVFTIILSIPRKFHSLSKTRSHDKTIHRFLSSPVPLTSISVLTLVHDKPLYIYVYIHSLIEQ